MIALSITLAFASAELDAHLAGSYLYFHVLLLIFAVALLTYAAELMHLPTLVRQAALALPLLSAPSLISFPASRAARELLTQPTWAGRQLVEYVQFHLDLDHDGHSPAFGGDDCDDSDTSVFVAAPEKPGDGRDSDCDGADAPKASDLTFEAFHGLQDEKAREIADRAKALPTLVILVDALRFDRVGDARFPNLAQLSRESLRFTRVYSTSSNTLSSVPAMMSGYERPLAARDNIVQAVGHAGQSSRFIASDVLATHFERLGTRNPVHDFSSSSLIASTDSSSWAEGDAAASDDRISLSAISDLQSSRPSSLLWLHYFGLHEWAASSDFGSLTRGDDERYDTALARLDKSLEPLLALRDRVAVVLLADHGEGLGARGIEHHANFVFQELAHIPVLVRVPGVEASSIDVPLGSTCVFNTLRALRGLEVDPGADPSLLGFVAASNVGQGPGFAAFETAQWSLLYGSHRLLYMPRHQLTELYDVRLDPTESRNRADDNPRLASQLLGRLLLLRNSSPQ